MNALATKHKDVEALRQSVRSLEAQQSKLDTALDSLDGEVSRLSGVASDLGYPGVLPEPKTTRPNRGAILLYHRVALLDPDPARLCIGPQVFRAQMEHVARTCEPMTLDALTEAAGKSQIPYRAVAITLDDGYADALVASDILCTLHLPATFFVNSSAGAETFHDCLARIFLELDEIPSELDVSMMGARLRLPCAGNQARRATFEALSEIGWPLSSEARREVIAALRRWTSIDLAPRRSHRLLMPAELRELANRPGHSIGAHTDNHLFLPAQPRSVKIREIAANRRFLQDVVGQEVSSFAYPYGAFDAETVQICRSMGFRSGVTVIGQPVRPWNGSLVLPRTEVKVQRAAEFDMFMSALF